MKREEEMSAGKQRDALGTKTKKHASYEVYEQVIVPTGIGWRLQRI